MSGLNGELVPVSPMYLAVLGYLNSHGCNIHFDSYNGRSCLVTKGKRSYRLYHNEDSLMLYCAPRSGGTGCNYCYTDPMMLDKVYDMMIGK